MSSRNCQACLAREAGMCDWCRRRQLCRMAVSQLSNLRPDLGFDRWFWLYAAAHALTCRLRSHGDCKAGV